MIFTFLWRHVELWTAEKGLKPRYFIRDSLICPPIFARWQPSIGYPILGPMPPLVLFMISMLTRLPRGFVGHGAKYQFCKLDKKVYGVLAHVTKTALVISYHIPQSSLVIVNANGMYGMLHRVPTTTDRCCYATFVSQKWTKSHIINVLLTSFARSVRESIQNLT